MDLTRRTVLLAGLAAASVAVGTAATEGTFAAHSRELPLPPLDGELRFDKASRIAAADDFGHIVHRTPKGVLLPGSDQDVATTIRWAGGLGRKIAPQGQSHSVYGRAQVRAGIVIDMTQLRTVHDVQNDRVVVDAGAKWSEVLAATLPQGLTPPVLTDYLELSVGGTLVVGGIGGTTSQYGMQSDNVLELDVVTGTGEKVTCSPDSNADLFDAVRAGLGQVAVITRATLKLIPAPEHVRRYVLTYPDLRTLLTDERLLAADNRFDAVQGAALPTPTGWKYRLDAVAQFSGKQPAGRRRTPRWLVRRSVRGTGKHTAVFRLPQPACCAGAASAIQRPVVLPASVAHHLRRGRRGRVRGQRRVGHADASGPGHPSARSCSPLSAARRSPARCCGCRRTLWYTRST